MASSKAVRTKIRLVSSGKNAKGKATGFFYTTNKNKREHPEKMETMKFDPRAFNPETGKTGMHVRFKENSKFK